MKGKQKCKILKEIRAQIAKENDIEWVTENCTHKGDCRGTCPKCEAEVRMLERALECRRALGHKVALAGISAGIAFTSLMSTACSADALDTLIDSVEELFDNGEQGGDPIMPENHYTTTTTTRYDVIDGDIGGVPMPPEYDLREFEACAPKRYTVENEKAFAVYLEKIADIKYPSDEDNQAFPGDRFTVVGVLKNDENMSIVSCDGNLYAVYNGDIEDLCKPLPILSEEFEVNSWLEMQLTEDVTVYSLPSGSAFEDTPSDSAVTLKKGSVMLVSVSSKEGLSVIKYNDSLYFVYEKSLEGIATAIPQDE